MTSCAVRTYVSSLMKYGALFVLLAAPAAFAQPVPDGAQPAPDGAPSAQPAAMPAPPPAMMAATRATFVSTSEEQWDVYLDRQAVCSTPCTVGVLPVQFVALRTQERNPIRLDVGHMPEGDVMVSAKPLSDGLYATGIVFTAFSGMAAVTGVTLTAVGCSTDHPTMCHAGIITGVAGGIGLYGSIYLMRKALPRASIGPARPYVAGTQMGLAGRF